ncbi:MAG TPA: glycosyltransferase family A protein [Crinalium sp.]|jgi:glycosyltransferase involved in cell wall biosynthesis
MPRVSVIIPAYNGDRYIAETIESVLHQTYSDYKIIVIDDGSKDNTRQAVEPYLQRLRYIYQENQGVAAARNHGLRLAQGEFIAFLDQDDVLRPDKLAAQVAYLDANPQIGMVHSGWQRIDHRGEPLGVVEPWHQAPQLDLEAWVWWKPVLLSAMMFRRSWVEKANGLDTAFKQACDVDLALRLTLMGCETGWLRQITVGYREHDRNDSRNTPLQAQENEKALDKFFSLPHIPDSIRQLEQKCRYYTLVWSAWRLYLTGHTAEMQTYLEKSLHYTPFSPSETILDWINNFSTYTADYGRPFDAFSLSNSQEWKQLVSLALA